MAEASDVKRGLSFPNGCKMLKKALALKAKPIVCSRWCTGNELEWIISWAESGLYRQCTCGVYVKNGRVPALLQRHFPLLFYPRPTTWRMLLRPFGYSLVWPPFASSTAPAYWEAVGGATNKAPLPDSLVNLGASDFLSLRAPRACRCRRKVLRGPVFDCPSPHAH